MARVLAAEGAATTMKTSMPRRTMATTRSAAATTAVVEVAAEAEGLADPAIITRVGMTTMLRLIIIMRRSAHPDHLAVRNTNLGTMTMVTSITILITRKRSL